MIREQYDVDPFQLRILNDLNKYLDKPIPLVDERGLPSFGVKIEENKIVCLWLDRCGFTKFPEEILKLDTLQELHLGYNLLANIPQTIHNLHSLVKLNLRWNFINSLPDT